MVDESRLSSHSLQEKDFQRPSSDMAIGKKLACSRSYAAAAAGTIVSAPAAKSAFGVKNHSAVSRTEAILPQAVIVANAENEIRGLDKFVSTSIPSAGNVAPAAAAATNDSPARKPRSKYAPVPLPSPPPPPPPPPPTPPEIAPASAAPTLPAPTEETTRIAAATGRSPPSSSDCRAVADEPLEAADAGGPVEGGLPLPAASVMDGASPVKHAERSAPAPAPAAAEAAAAPAGPSAMLSGPCKRRPGESAVNARKAAQKQVGTSSLLS
jgi:hypothetical protein